MFCRNCGKEMQDKSSVCIYCGVKKNHGNKYCPNCGCETEELADFCTNCGIKLPKLYPSVQGKSKVLAGLLGIFLGGFGIHRFYLGYFRIGLLQLLLSICSLGLTSIWGFIEGILILCDSIITTDHDGIPLV